MSKDSPEKHPDGFVSIRVVPREIGKIIYAGQWGEIAKKLQKRGDLNREYAAAREDETDPATVAAISSRLSAAEAAVRPEWARLLIEADRLITSDDLPLYCYRRDALPYPVPKDRFAGDTDQHAQTRRLILLTGKINVKLALNKRYLARRGSQVDLRSLVRNTADSVTLVGDIEKDVKEMTTKEMTTKEMTTKDVIVLERDLREALQRLRENLGEQQTTGPPPPPPEGDDPTGPGRPSLRAEIRDAYLALEGDAKVNFDEPKAALYEPIRKKVRTALGKPKLSKGLGDEVIRDTIAPLFEADKTKQQSASP